MTKAVNPKVFISYSWDSAAHSERVLKLSNRLRSEGIDAILDQYESSPAEGWPRWMDKQIRDANFVLSLCTETYNRRVMGEETPGQGLGVRWEGHLIYQHIYQGGTLNQRFIPVIFEEKDRDHIPTPLQSASHYCLASNAGYDDLYNRLRGISKVQRPTLGKLRPLPKRDLKTNVGMFVTGFIDVERWNKAIWKGVAILSNFKDPPMLGLAFEDEKAATEIFEGWHKRIGKVDAFEELRVSLIEGEIEGEESGYSVHIGANIENVLKRMDALGIEVPKDYFVTVSRIHRMNPEPGSNNLAIFKDQFKKFNRYSLVPVILEKDGKHRVGHGFAIEKREVIFRQSTDIKDKNDPDAVVVPKFHSR